ncbi:MAG: citrate/2-methylcitrate synthase [Candidatus Omnitrophota bacterium]|nr:MAG: citrate/2-methylcitrate synthase [Candidatus Omnitrophota bacterium]
MNHNKTKKITDLVLKAGKTALAETNTKREPEPTKSINWPVDCVVGPGLEGAIACESKIGYVNGAKGWLLYGGYNIFDLCAYSSFEEVCYLLLYGKLPTTIQLALLKNKLIKYRNNHQTLRALMNFSVQEMNPMAALRLGTNLMRNTTTDVNLEGYVPENVEVISADEDSIPMETQPLGQEHAIYEFPGESDSKKVKGQVHPTTGIDCCLHLISGIAVLSAAILRLRNGYMPLEPDPELSHAANFIYMATGRRPSPEEERIMDITLILHADHGMNASTFAAMVVASTLSDMYYSVGSGIAALNGPLHGGANEQVLKMLKEIDSVENVKPWFAKARANKQKIMGFGHRVYKAYDPRARVLAPLAKYLSKGNRKKSSLFAVAQELESQVIATLGVEKRIFPNVDFYSGIVYSCLGIPPDMFTTLFAVSRVAGWTARIQEYLRNNRIFRPRARYIGPFDMHYVPIARRSAKKK